MGNALKAFHKGELHEVGLPVLGGCVGHNCRIGSGHVVYPARMIDSDVVLTAKQEQTVITKNVKYEHSDHHRYPNAGHVTKYHDDELLEDTDSSSIQELMKSAP
jgi:hypothetical protein